MWQKLPEWAKSILAGIFAALSFLVPVVDDGLLWSEVLGALVAFGISAGVVWAVPNKKYKHVEYLEP